ncbi:SH3 domain-containing protein [Magnetospirillum fulvum]|uniref:SH3 domain-containing protein n=1 Tax=Magnetospirillum fulvum MGU-K5 TaxID=1316936 RepID=S9S821_MAGFU|nr:SH3 domain-containing protein [Magnetospirillum fulvum]EPY02032.1 hypothetical protein K678_08062 [Magnetospirillum fulvum MGU-K5]
MSIRSVTVLAATLVLVATGEARATADGPDHYRLRDGAPAPSLILRAQPGFNAAPITQLPVGARCLRSLGCRGGLTLDEATTLSETEKHDRAQANPRWCRVEHQGRVGWLDGTWLTEESCPAARDPFPPGRDTGEIRGHLRGRADADYRVPLLAGQRLRVRMTASNPQTYFNVLPPGSDEARFVGSQSGDSFDGVAPTDGAYLVRVYLMRPAARRNEQSDFRLAVTRTGQPLPPLSAAEDALVPGTPYHAVAEVPCTVAFAPSPLTCQAGVIRRGHDRTATVEIRWEQNTVARMRRVLFVHGTPIVADGTDPIHADRHEDWTILRIGDQERFEIPDALLDGG